MRPTSPLHKLAKSYGLQTEYRDMSGRLQAAEPASLCAVLRSLGASIHSPEDAVKAFLSREKELWSRWAEPVAVVWQGRQPLLKLRLPKEDASGRLQFHLQLESGEERSGVLDLSRAEVLRTAEVSGRRYVLKAALLPERLPLGYHPLRLRLGKRTAQTFVISAPQHGFPPFGNPARKGWGLFAPAYAVHSARSWGAGDLTDLESLARWAGGMGADMIATLPLFPLFLSRKRFEPSPYAPISRLFWNEFWLDPGRLPEWDRCPSARNLAGSSGFRKTLKSLRSAPWVDYRRQMECKRRVLQRLAECFFRGGGDRETGFRDFLRAHPETKGFARFRAQAEGTGNGRYHLYVQWAADQQMREFRDRCRQHGVSLYLDFPIGVHPDGYDVQRWKEIFVPGVSAGAPPDSLFGGGQDWGFAPAHPEAVRRQGYRYFRNCLAHSMQFSSLLRIDHVMGFHRLFWVPRKFGARQGIYVRYPAEEWTAVLALESQRNRCTVVGENLGIVPRQVQQSLRRRRFLGMFVVQYEMSPKTSRSLPEVPPLSVASLNTHDTPPFAAFLKQRKDLQGVLTAWLRSGRWLKNRDSVLQACLRALAAGRARVLQISPEDLWGETQPQNVPGTSTEIPNWRRKWRYSLEQLESHPGIRKILQEVNRLRRHD